MLLSTLSRPVLGAAALVVTGLLASAPARAGELAGTVELKPNKPGSPPVKNKGFLDRIENPIKPTKSYEPWPYMVVVAVGDVPDEAKASNTPVVYALIGESFRVPLQPVLAGREVEIRNTGTSAPVLYASEAPDAFTTEPLNPSGIRTIKGPKSGQVLHLRSQDTPHLEGRIVGFETPYFSVVGDGGRYEITDLPAGNWTVKVWYRDGWLDVPDKVVELGRGKTKHDIDVPPTLTTK